jgi:N-acetylglutamate synthase-like GNAT family acetyltransferase
VHERSIRAARQSDAAAIVELLAELGYPTTAPEAELRLRRSLSGDHGGVLVLEIEGRVVGLAS